MTGHSFLSGHCTGMTGHAPIPVTIRDSDRVTGLSSSVTGRPVITKGTFL